MDEPTMARFVMDVSAHPVVAQWPVTHWRDLLDALNDLGWRLVKDQP